MAPKAGKRNSDHQGTLPAHRSCPRRKENGHSLLPLGSQVPAFPTSNLCLHRALWQGRRSSPYPTLDHRAKPHSRLQVRTNVRSSTKRPLPQLPRCNSLASRQLWGSLCPLFLVLTDLHLVLQQNVHKSYHLFTAKTASGLRSYSSDPLD